MRLSGLPVSKLPVCFFVATALLALAACGKKDQGDTNKANTQVVAKVNGKEITIYQVNFQLSQLGQMNQEQAKQASKQVLARLVEQEILKQQAESTKLDKDPVVLQALEASKNQLLAQAYLDRLIAKAPKASSAEIDTFYKDHPELFEARRIYSLQELVVGASKDKFSEISEGLKTVSDINGIATWLKDHKYPFSVNSNAKAAEQLPMELLKKLQQMKVGQVLLVPTPATFNIIQVVAAEDAPIDRTKAKPIIEQYFLNQAKTSMAKKEVTSLNEKANIEFQGMFAEMKKSDLIQLGTANAGAARPSAQPAAQAKPATQTPAPANKPKESSGIDKGLSGL